MCANRVYLTFDDGPDPELTPRVLDLGMLLITNFALWALALELPNVLRQL